MLVDQRVGLVIGGRMPV